MSTTTRDVSIGDRNFEIGAFSAFKAIEASSMLAGIFEEIPEVLEKASAWRQQWLDDNTLKLDRATAEMRYEEAGKVSEEAWAATGQVLRLPANPDGVQNLGEVLFPLIFQKARGRAVDLLALIMTPNSELEDADQGAGDVDVLQAIAANKRTMLHKGRPEQLVTLASASWEVLQDQLGPKAEEMRELWSKIQGVRGQATEAGSTSPQASDEPASSSRSRGRRRGPASKSSTESRGSKSASSVAS